MQNRIAKNRKSPNNEQAFIDAYKKQNPSALKRDNMDISAVTTRDGVKGHALMKEEHNRSRDNQYHRTEDFIPDSELKKKMKP
jgi:hypothetical protein